MGAKKHYFSDDSKKQKEKTVAVSGAWIRVVKGQSQVMLQIDGKWIEIFPYTNVADADISVEIPADQIRKSQPLGWLYKSGG